MGLPNQTQFYFESYIDFLRSQTDLLLSFFGSYIDFPSNLHLIMTAWLLQAVVLLPLSLKPKDLKSKLQFELKRKKKKKNKNRTICDKRKRWRYPFDRPPENILYRVGRCLPNVGVRLTDLEDTHELWRII